MQTKDFGRRPWPQMEGYRTRATMNWVLVASIGVIAAFVVWMILAPGPVQEAANPASENTGLSIPGPEIGPDPS